ncbi:MAG: hypothetical protein PUA84_10055 [Oscillospiraceae bacterium]|nr:hypothetical protein [Oscillospiraceae bacterium]
MEKKTINLAENMELAHNMAGCAVLLEIALAEPSTDTFTASIMRAVKFAVLAGASKLKDTTKAMSLLLKAVDSKHRNKVSIPKTKAEELAKLLKEVMPIIDND